MSLLRVWERIFLNPSRALGRQGRRKDIVSLLLGDGAGQQSSPRAALTAVPGLAPQKGLGWNVGLCQALPELCQQSQGRSQCHVLALGSSASLSADTAEEPPRFQTCLSISDPQHKALPPPCSPWSWGIQSYPTEGLSCLPLAVKNPLPQLSLCRAVSSADLLEDDFMFSSRKDVTQLRIDHCGASWKLLGDDSLFTVTLGALSVGFQVSSVLLWFLRQCSLSAWVLCSILWHQCQGMCQHTSPSYSE